MALTDDGGSSFFLLGRDRLENLFYGTKEAMFFLRAIGLRYRVAVRSFEDRLQSAFP